MSDALRTERLTKRFGATPIPGTNRVSRTEENAAADRLELTADQLRRLEAIPAATGDRYADMSTVGR
ncbi:MAG TPA: hypothetical protein VFP31_08735 [Gaiellaceae bacterium]|nr:hypothetical protein [Gaiellaceae bacterium]